MGFKHHELLFSVIIRCALLKIIKTSNYMFVIYNLALIGKGLKMADSVVVRCGLLLKKSIR